MFVLKAAPRNAHFIHRQARRIIHNLGSVDIAIVGGGPVGLSLACALSSSKPVRNILRVALIEGGDLNNGRRWAPEPDQFSNRVSSITNASREFLKDIGVWDYVEQSRTAPIEEMQVWDGLSDSRIYFSSSDIPHTRGTSSKMAYMTENLNLVRALLRRLEKFSEVLLLDKSKVEAIRKGDGDQGGWPSIHLAGGRQLRARLVVGADGFNSPVRSYANISSFGWSYNTQAIVATLEHAPRVRTEYSDQAYNATAYQRFLTTGPIAFLPLSPVASSLVWSTKPDVAAALLSSEPNVLSTMVNAAFRLPDISLKYLNQIILEAHRSGSTLSLPNILEELKWREQSHGIEPHSAYSSVDTSTQEGIQASGSELLPPIITSIQSGTITSFPIRFNHADAYVGEGDGERTVLVGDAAHTIHPLAGQGLNLGLADVRALTRSIESTVLHGGDIGCYTSLLPYAGDRYFENHKVLSATDKLHRLYTSTSGPIVWARSVGLEVINEIDVIKEALMSSAGATEVTGTGPVRDNAQLWRFAAMGAKFLAESRSMAGLLLGSLARSATEMTPPKRDSQ